MRIHCHRTACVHCPRTAYDALGRTLTVTEPDPDGAGPLAAPLTTYAYDDDGDMVSETTLDGTTSYQYDALGRLTKLTMPDPDGAGSGLAPWTVFAYNAAGWKTSETNRLGNGTTYDYDNLGRVTKVTDAESGETSYTYDAKGNRLTLTDPVGNTTTWTYDKLDRVLTDTNELSDTRTSQYDAAGNLTQLTDRNGRVTTYEYDDLNRRTAENWLDGMTTLRTFTYSYDAASQLVSASDPAADYTFTYDNLGRNTSTEYDYASLGFDVVIDESYDALGRRTQLAAEIDGTDDLINEYQYDYLNRLTQITQDAQSGGNAVAEKRVDFTYDAEDKQQFTSITRYADLAGSDTVAISTYGYDDTDRLTSLTHVDGSSGSLAGYTWQYDEGNRLTDFTVSGYSAEDATYSYDDTDQLTAADRSGTSADESYAYDDNGNRTGGSYSTGDDNQLSSDGTYNYTYDDEGNRLTKTNISTGEVFEYSWDYRNRLTSITTKDNVGTITHEVEYTYDIFNRRIVKTIDADGAGAGTATEEIYIHEGLREERDSAGDQILLAFDESGDLTERYLHGPAVDQILASEDVTSLSTSGDVLWALSDNLGSVRDVAEYDDSTDTTTVINHITYGAFGNVTNETNSSVDFLFAYTGRERDAESKLQYNRARYYDSGVGRWISKDPIGFEAGDANLYRYVDNVPLGATDPSGLERIADNFEDILERLNSDEFGERQRASRDLLALIDAGLSVDEIGYRMEADFFSAEVLARLKAAIRQSIVGQLSVTEEIEFNCFQRAADLASEVDDLIDRINARLTHAGRIVFSSESASIISIIDSLGLSQDTVAVMRQLSDIDKLDFVIRPFFSFEVDEPHPILGKLEEFLESHTVATADVKGCGFKMQVTTGHRGDYQPAFNAVYYEYTTTFFVRGPGDRWYSL